MIYFTKNNANLELLRFLLSIVSRLSNYSAYVSNDRAHQGFGWVGEWANIGLVQNFIYFLDILSGSAPALLSHAGNLHNSR